MGDFFFTQLDGVVIQLYHTKVLELYAVLQQSYSSKHRTQTDARVVYGNTLLRHKQLVHESVNEKIS
mgnify:CR=1 FL=1